MNFTDTSLSGRYAFVIYQQFYEKAVPLLQELSELADLFSVSDDIKNSLFSPFFSYTKKMDVLTCLLETYGASQEAKRTLHFLLSQKRLNYFSNILKAFKKCVNEKLCALDVCIETAKKLDEGEKESLETLFIKFFKKTPLWTHIIDPSLIAGYVMQFDHKRVDLSLKTYAKELLVNGS